MQAEAAGVVGQGEVMGYYRMIDQPADSEVTGEYPGAAPGADAEAEQGKEVVGLQDV